MDSEEDLMAPETKKRRLKTPSQLEALERFYNEHRYPSEAMKLQISVELGLSERQVQGWFCHRRLKDKKLMKDENVVSKKQPATNAAMQEFSNGTKQESSSSGKTAEHHSHSNVREPVRKPSFSPMDFPAAVLASELRDSDLLRGSLNNKHEARVGNGSASHEKQSIPNSKPYKSDALKNSFQKSSITEVDTRNIRGNGQSSSTYLDNHEEHEAITTLKEQLGDEYTEDGPVLGVIFHSVPPGAFEDDNELNGDEHYREFEDKPKDSGKGLFMESFPLPLSARMGPGHNGFSSSRKVDHSFAMPERMSPKPERTNNFSHVSSLSKYSARQTNSYIQSTDNYHVPDLNSSMQLDDDSAEESPTSRYPKKPFATPFSSDMSGRRSPASHLPYAYSNKSSAIPGKSLNNFKEFAPSQLHNSNSLYSSIPGTTNGRSMVHVMPHSALLQPQDTSQPRRIPKRERIQEERKMDRDQNMLRLKQKYISKEDKMACL